MLHQRKRAACCRAIGYANLLGTTRTGRQRPDLDTERFRSSPRTLPAGLRQTECVVTASILRECDAVHTLVPLLPLESCTAENDADLASGEDMATLG
jgi:hypothetical protein